MLPSCRLSISSAIITTLIVIKGACHKPHIEYTTITGYFLQDDPSTDPATFEYNTTNFGLIDRPYDTDNEYDPDHTKTQWERFDHKVFRLNRESGRNVQYKVLYMGRHGEGYHNVAEAFYGTPAWDRYWSLQPGNGTTNWTDASLTPIGVQQAEVAHDFWKRQLAEEKMPAPETYYVSPLDRALATADITFSGLDLPPSRQFIPEIKELLREVIGIHTCDLRSSKSFIRAKYPSFTFESGFAENDPLWQPDIRETDSERDTRLKVFLDDIFKHDHSTYISLTSHSGATNSILKIVGHRPFRLATGAMIPVVVKAEVVRSSVSSTSVTPPTGVPTCSSDPIPTPMGLN